MTIRLLAAIVLAAATAAPGRHAVAGRFRIPYAAAAHTTSAENLVANPGFESGAVDRGWHQCGDVLAYVARQHPYRGSFDEYSGTRSGKGEPLGNSGVCQQVTIPRNGVLTVALYQLSNEPDTLYAYQEGDLLDGRGRVVVNLFKSVNNSAGWVQGRWNLAAYAGRTVWLYFGVHGDGSPHTSTQQFVDEVSLAPNRE